jgi:hypothetical protein
MHWRQLLHVHRVQWKFSLLSFVFKSENNGTNLALGTVVGQKNTITLKSLVL